MGLMESKVDGSEGAGRGLRDDGCDAGQPSLVVRTLCCRCTVQVRNPVQAWGLGFRRPSAGQPPACFYGRFCLPTLSPVRNQPARLRRPTDNKNCNPATSQSELSGSTRCWRSFLVAGLTLRLGKDDPSGYIW